MTLYVGGTTVIENINSPVSGKYSATFNFVEVTDILHDYELLTRGYIISGYKSAQCQDDVNKVIYATNTNTHLAGSVTPGNYNGGVSGTQTAVAIAMNTGQCQGSPERSSAKVYQSFDMNTDTKISQGSMNYGRYAASYWTQTDTQKGYATLGGSNSVDRYTFSSGTRDTAPSCSAGWSTYFMSAWPGSTYGHVADNANETWQSMNSYTHSWTNSGKTNTWYITGVNPAAHTKSDIAYIGNQGVGDMRRFRDIGNNGAIVHTSHGRWPPWVNNGATDNYYGEGNWMKGNYLSRAMGGHDGIQHNKAAIVNNGTDTVWGCPSMDGFGAYSVCSASGHWA